MPDYEKLREYSDRRLEALRDAREGWLTTYRDLSDHYLPRRIRWLFSANEMRGRQAQSKLIDTTSILAARACAAGMMSGITSPTRPWFKLAVDGVSDSPDNEVAVWLADCEARVYRVMAISNFYNAMAQNFWDLVIFGTAPVLAYEDFEDVVRFFNPAPGEFLIEQNDQERVDTLYREFTLSVAGAEKKFGKERLSAPARQSLDQKANRGRELLVAHSIEPNRDDFIAKKFKFIEFFWERGSARTDWLECRGLDEWPGFVARWDTMGADAYGYSPAMDGLPDVKQLQQESRRKAQALDKMVNPPLMADIQLKNQPTSALPGGITYVSNLAAGGGMKSIYQTQFPVQEVREDIAEIQQRIRSILFNDLFNMISQLQTVRTATEIDARREEKLIMLGPVLERFQNEGLDPVVKRIFQIMARRGLFLPPPEAVRGAKIEIQYVSMLTEAQRAASTGAIERVLAQLGSLAAVDPGVLDKVNLDNTVEEYAQRLNLPPRLLNDEKRVAAIRAERAKQQQQAQMMQMTDPAVKGASVLSKTDVGGGQNALAQMMGMGEA